MDIRTIFARPFLLVAALATFVALVACGGGGPTRAELAVVAIEATSNTSLLVTFGRPVDASATLPENYLIRDSDGARLRVVAAYRQADPTRVAVATAPQKMTSYTIVFRNLHTFQGQPLATANSSFGGSGETAPIVASAISLSNTQVLITFATPTSGQLEVMQEGAEDIANYDITEPNPVLDKTPDLTILSAELNQDGTKVVLTTEPQADVLYEITVTNVLSKGSKKLVDPFLNTAEFNGIPAEDLDPPTVLDVAATSNTTVLVNFSEPVTRNAGNADRYTIVAADGTVLPVQSAELDEFGTQVLLTTLPMLDETTVYTLSIANIRDRAGNTISPNPFDIDFNGISRRGPIDGDTEPPRVSNTGSTGNTTVVVSFSEPIETTSAETAVNYRIVGAEPLDGAIGSQRANLPVLAAVLSGNRTSVVLTTGSQTDIQYVLAVSNVTDLAGNQIAPPQLGIPNPSAVTFYGTAPSGDDLVDSDGDGLSDDEELLGWRVRVVRLDGTVQNREVTSDPNSADTDGDDVSDFDEKNYGADPRNDDSDDDNLTDWQELNTIYTDPVVQDSDGDGLADGLEFDFFKTSPLFEDTDGDQLSDADEVNIQNRNPLEADLPDFTLQVVGDVSLGLDVRFTAESSSGSRNLETRSSSTTLSSSSSRTNESSRATGTEWFINAGVGLEWPIPSAPTLTVTADGGYKESTETSFGQQSVRETQEEQARSLSTDRETERGETVTREVLGASMSVALQIDNLSDIAFTLDNVQVIAKIVNPRDPTEFIPVATLLPAGPASFTLGPAPDSRGPFQFVADDPTPALIEQLRANPSNLVFEIANYDVSDEFGRNFSYTYQDVNDRTATLFIDYGGRATAEVHRAATGYGRIAPFADTNGDGQIGDGDSLDTNGDGTVDDGDRIIFDASGRQVGASLGGVLQDVVGLSYVSDADDAALEACLNANSCSAAQRALADSSYSTRDVSGERVLWRVRTVVSDPANGFRWFSDYDTPVGVVPPDDINDVIVGSGRYFRFLFGQDLDGDELTVQVENFYGSVDSDADELNNACFGDPTATGCNTPDGVPDSRDTDRDGIEDDEEVYGFRNSLDDYDPWLVQVRGNDAYPTSSSPARFDTDLDGITDCQELGRCTVFVYAFPNDTTRTPGADQAALRASLETDPANGAVVGLFPDANGRPGILSGTSAAWELLFPETGQLISSDPARFDSDLDGLSDGVEVVGPRFTPIDAEPGDNPVQLLPGPGSSDPATEPLDADTDGDLLGDGDEVQLGTDPTSSDSNGDSALDVDGDGLRSIEEDVGWVVAYRNAAGVWFDGAGNALKANGQNQLLDAAGDPVPVDRDGNPVDYTLLVLPSNAAPARTTSDKRLFDTDRDGLSDGQERAARTNPRSRDTDGDGLIDSDELLGVDYPPDAANPVRFTNVLAADSDADGRDDGEEVGTSWTVAVTGNAPYRTYSDPLVDDADLDGLGDSGEFDEKTDPNLADTDGDGIDDLNEVNSSYARSPIVPDQVVEFRYSSATLLKSCYLIPGEESLEDWTLSGNNLWLFFLFSDPSALIAKDFGGNPDGYVVAKSASGDIAFNAPAAFTGDQSAFYGEAFSFSLKEYLLDSNQTRFTPNVFLVGNGMTLRRDVPQHEDTSWTTVSVTLSETDGWIDTATSAAVSQADFQAVLADLTAVRIEGAYESNSLFESILFGGVGLDAVRLGNEDNTAAVTSGFDAGALAAGNYTGNFKVEFPDQSGSGALTVEDLASAGELSAETAGTTVQFAGAIQTFVVGRDQGFRVFSTNVIEAGQAYSLGLDPDDFADYGNFSVFYTAPIIGGSENETLRGSVIKEDGGTCQLDVAWTWRVLE